jgi:cell division protein FtsA
MAKGRIITGLDIGTSAIKALVVFDDLKEEKIQVLSQIKENSFGVRRGVVVNIEEVAEIIASLLSKAREETGQKIDEVFVNLGGSHIFCQPSRGLVSVSRADQKISQEDIERAINAAQIFPLSPNKEILEIIPREFIVDGENGIKDPLNLKGVRLEVDALAVGCFSPYLKSLTQAVLAAGVQIGDIFLTPLASAQAVLKPREKELGVALLDIGAGTSSFAVFEEGNLLYTIILPVGSANITNDIAIYLKTDIDMAERIKLEFGSCLPRNGNKKERIKSEFSSEPLIFSRKNLVDIIQIRVKQIFSQVAKELKKISKYGALPSGIVLTGGGAKLPRIVDLAKKELKLPCRLGLPQGLSSFQEDSSFSTALGLVLLARQSHDHSSRVRSGFGEKIKKIFRIFNI